MNAVRRFCYDIVRPLATPTGKQIIGVSTLCGTYFGATNCIGDEKSAIVLSAYKGAVDGVATGVIVASLVPSQPKPVLVTAIVFIGMFACESLWFQYRHCPKRPHAALPPIVRTNGGGNDDGQHNAS